MTFVTHARDSKDGIMLLATDESGSRAKSLILTCDRILSRYFISLDIQPQTSVPSDWSVLLI